MINCHESFAIRILAYTNRLSLVLLPYVQVYITHGIMYTNSAFMRFIDSRFISDMKSKAV